MDHQFINPDRDYRNNASYQRHKKQRLWQILLPVILTGLFLLVVAVLVVIRAAGPSGSDAPSQWADASLIWLIIPMMLFAFGAALFLMALIILTGKVVHILPNYTFEAQRYGNILSSLIKFWSNKLTSPIIAVESIFARVSAFFSALLGRTRQ
jgi:hypothetical protein